MKKIILLVSLVLIACSSEQINQVINATMSQGGLTKSQIGMGLKEALSVGLNKAILGTSKKDGYLGNSLIKIPFPEEAKVVQGALSKIGLNSLNNKVVTSLNRAAEDAATAAKPIFTSAITKLTFSDVMKIFNGPNNAATEYLKKATTPALIQAFKPSISKSLNKVDATKYWGDVMSKYNKISMFTGKKVDTNLQNYVTSQAISGLFKEIAKEEAQIRLNPAARTTNLLKRVFGAK